MWPERCECPFWSTALCCKAWVKVPARRGCCSDVVGHGDAQNYLHFESVMSMHAVFFSRDEELVLVRAVCRR